MKLSSLVLLAAVLYAASLRAGVYPNTPARLWPGGVVPIEYDNDPSININQRLVLVSAMVQWMNAANVHFVLRTNNEPDYLFIRQGGTNQNPTYGGAAGYRTNTGPHNLNLDSWGTNNNDYLNCQLVFGLAHEVGHALGLSHTHQSQTRSNYFIVRTNLVASGLGNFTIDTSSLQWPRTEPDIDSIMTYPLCALSSCGFSTCKTNLQNCAPLLLQEPWASQWATNLTCPNSECPPPLQCVGQRNHLSVWDKAVMSYLYPQPNWRFAEAGSVQTNVDGTFHYPAKSFTNGVARTPAGGTLFLEPATYANSVGVHGKAMTIRATRTGSVLIR